MQISPLHIAYFYGILSMYQMITREKEAKVMAMSAAERKRLQRSREVGYAKSREVDWRIQNIKGATYERYLQLLVGQGYKCPICSLAIDNRSPLDHCHETGEVRAVLCTRCNLLVGKIECVRIEAVQSVISYLKERC